MRCAAALPLKCGATGAGGSEQCGSAHAMTALKPHGRHALAPSRFPTGSRLPNTRSSRTATSCPIGIRGGRTARERATSCLAAARRRTQPPCCLWSRPGAPSRFRCRSQFPPTAAISHALDGQRRGIGTLPAKRRERATQLCSSRRGRPHQGDHGRSQRPRPTCCGPERACLDAPAMRPHRCARRSTKKLKELRRHNRLPSTALPLLRRDEPADIAGCRGSWP